jgi:hypothetical protein
MTRKRYAFMVQKLNEISLELENKNLKPIELPLLSR